MTTSFHHFNFRSVHPAEAVAFYGRLGFELVGCMQLEALYTLYLGVHGEGNGPLIEISVRKAGDWDRGVGSGHLAIAVDDLEQTYAQCVAHGFEFEAPPAPVGDRPEPVICFTRDPDGNRVELIQGPFKPPTDALPAGLHA